MVFGLCIGVWNIMLLEDCGGKGFQGEQEVERIQQEGISYNEFLRICYLLFIFFIQVLNI